MAEEPTLPFLPSGSHNGCEAAVSRSFKRSRLQSSPPLSSDPPVFSSDDDPSADNYMGRERLKKKFRGPWYSHQPHDVAQGGKRSLQRQFDSAVFMGSDGTEADSDAEFSSAAHLSILTSPQRMTLRPAPKLSQPTPEQLVQRDIEACLEEGNQDVDLSGRWLAAISNDTIKPLSTLVIVPKASQGIEAEYERLRPQLKIFLSSNQLQRAPGELFKLRGLSVLSLRNNQLVYLPSAIRNLQKLVECNVANNSLHYLPYEILDLLSGTARLRTLILHPNPFYEPFDENHASPPESPKGPKIGLHRPSTSPSIRCCSDPTQKPRTWLPQWDIYYRCRTEVRFMDITGSLVKGPQYPSDDSRDNSPTASLQTHGVSYMSRSLVIPIAPPNDVPKSPKSDVPVSGVPSLLEIAARTWSSTPDLPRLSDWFGDPETEPEHLSAVLNAASVLRECEAGDRQCTICNRTFVVPRTEWIEWWEIGKKEVEINASVASPLRGWENRRDRVEKCLPLMRRGCSWKCVPGKLVEVDNESDKATS